MKILLVCLGNICRSPLAEGILRTKLSDEFEIDSVGTISYHEGKKADSRSIQVAKENGIDISKHRSQLITIKDLDYFDHILCMDRSNFEDVISMTKNENQRQKISLLLEKAGNSDDEMEVPDPYWGTTADFKKLFNLLNEACEKISVHLQTK